MYGTVSGLSKYEQLKVQLRSRPEISQENIRIELEKDPSIQPILQWKRNGIKPDWSTVAPYDRELKVFGTNGLP